MTGHLKAHGRAATGSASRYLQQLCKHWSHKATSEFDATHGTITFENGKRVEMTSTEGLLKVVVSVPEGDDLEQWKTVIDQHLTRFAFREEFDLEWQVDATQSVSRKT